MQTVNIDQHPDIAAIDDRIREKQKALDRLRQDMSEDAQQKQALLAVRKEEEAIEAAKQERRQAVARARQEAAAQLGPEFDALVLEAREATIKAAELHARIRASHDAIGRASGGRNPKPRLYIAALLPESPRNRTEFARWLREIERYVEALPKPRARKRKRKRLSD